MMTTRHTTDRSLVSRLDEIRRLSAALNQSPLEGELNTDKCLSQINLRKKC